MLQETESTKKDLADQIMVSTVVAAGPLISGKRICS